MRIISGKWKGKVLVAPNNREVRPTMDCAKEAIFNILNNTYQFEDIRVLDLFSGTGNIAFEFGSRGALDILCVEKEGICVNFIKKTSTLLNLPIKVVKSDVYKYLYSPSSEGFDIIFADPPYTISFVDLMKIVELVFKSTLLKSEGTFIIEHSNIHKLDHLPNFKESRRYGGSSFSFFVLS